MTGSWQWTLEPLGERRTRVTARIEYVLPGGALGRAANALLVERMNEKNAERLLENLKLVAEAEHAPT
jgi:uncharacterized membrane protein